MGLLSYFTFIKDRGGIFNCVIFNLKTAFLSSADKISDENYIYEYDIVSCIHQKSLVDTCYVPFLLLFEKKKLGILILHSVHSYCIALFVVFRTERSLEMGWLLMNICPKAKDPFHKLENYFHSYDHHANKLNLIILNTRFDNIQ